MKKQLQKPAAKKPAKIKNPSPKPARLKRTVGQSVVAGLTKIKVVGVGGGGGNAVTRMREDFTRGIDFIAINTDAQDLEHCNARKKIHIGKNLTKGLGTGMNPEIGRQAAEETRSEIVEALKGADLIFVTAGLGGGTGTGAAPIVVEAAKELGILTIAVVTKPFAFEGAQRARIAQDGLMKLKEKADTLIVVPNDRVFSIIDKDTPLTKAFEVVDDVLKEAVIGVSDLIAMPGIVNIDFADVKAIMQDAGTALVGIGAASGQERAKNAVSQAIHSPLLEVSIEGAKGVLFGVFGGRDLKMTEVNEIAKTISESIDASAKVIFGAYHDRKIKEGQIKVTLIATGFNEMGGMSKSHSIAPSLFSPASSSLMEKKIEFPPPHEKREVAHPAPAQDKGQKDKAAPPKKSNDVWDIPTFLRRKK